MNRVVSYLAFFFLFMCGLLPTKIVQKSLLTRREKPRDNSEENLPARCMNAGYWRGNKQRTLGPSGPVQPSLLWRILSTKTATVPLPWCLLISFISCFCFLKKWQRTFVQPQAINGLADCDGKQSLVVHRKKGQDEGDNTGTA